MVADDPDSFGDFFARLEGEGSVSATGGALAGSTTRGPISMLTPELFAARCPDCAAAEAPATPHFAAYRIAVADIEATEALFIERGLRFAKRSGRLWIDPSEAFGVVVEFSAAPAGVEHLTPNEETT